MSRYEHLTHSLTARLHELQHRVSMIEADICAPEDPDFSEQAVVDEADELLMASNEASLVEIQAMQNALGRLEGGAYGVCLGCGAAIHPGRLEAHPTASLCLTCANEDEQMHQLI